MSELIQQIRVGRLKYPFFFDSAPVRVFEALMMKLGICEGGEFLADKPFTDIFLAITDEARQLREYQEFLANPNQNQDIMKLFHVSIRKKVRIVYNEGLCTLTPGAITEKTEPSNAPINKRLAVGYSGDPNWVTLDETVCNKLIGLGFTEMWCSAVIEQKKSGGTLSDEFLETFGQDEVWKTHGLLLYGGSFVLILQTRSTEAFISNWVPQEITMGLMGGGVILTGAQEREDEMQELTTRIPELAKGELCTNTAMYVGHGLDPRKIMSIVYTADIFGLELREFGVATVKEMLGFRLFNEQPVSLIPMDVLNYIDVEQFIELFSNQHYRFIDTYGLLFMQIRGYSTQKDERCLDWLKVISYGGLDRNEYVDIEVNAAGLVCYSEEGVHAIAFLKNRVGGIAMLPVFTLSLTCGDIYRAFVKRVDYLQLPPRYPGVGDMFEGEGRRRLFTEIMGLHANSFEEIEMGSVLWNNTCKDRYDNAVAFILVHIASRIGLQVNVDEYFASRNNGTTNYANVTNDNNVENDWWTTETFRDAAEWIRYLLHNQGTPKQVWWNDNVVRETIKLYEERLNRNRIRPTQTYAYFSVNEKGCTFVTLEEFFKTLLAVVLIILAATGKRPILIIIATVMSLILIIGSGMGRPLHRILRLTNYCDLPPNSDRKARAAVLATIAGLKKFHVPFRSWGEADEFSSTCTFHSRVFTCELAREGAQFIQLKDGVVKMTWPKRPERSPKYFRMTNDVLRLTAASNADRIEGLVDYHNHEYVVG